MRDRGIGRTSLCLGGAGTEREGNADASAAGTTVGGSIAGLYGHACRTPAGLLEALRDRGDVWPGEAALCIVAWLCDVAGWPSVTPRELAALVRGPETRVLVPRLRQTADALRSCVASGLLEPVAAGDGQGDVEARTIVRPRERGLRGPCYRPTALGRAVAASPPGRRRGSALRRFAASQRGMSRAPSTREAG
jgi:hypothetical protein